jgi:hypothetical protein
MTTINFTIGLSTKVVPLNKKILDKIVVMEVRQNEAKLWVSSVDISKLNLLSFLFCLDILLLQCFIFDMDSIESQKSFRPETIIGWMEEWREGRRTKRLSG